MSENTKTKDQKANLVWIIFALVIVAVYLTGLTIPLLGPDESRYSQVAREMFERSDWITPKLGGFDWFEKPALLYWLQIVFYKIFGVTEFAARFGSAIFGLGTIFSLWLLGRNYPQINTNAPELKVQHPTSEIQNRSDFANWLALIAASSIGLIAFSRGASFDIILTFPLTASLVSFFLFDQSERKSGFTFYFLLSNFYFFIGIALIAKGLVGIVFPFAIVAFYHLLSWKFPSRTFIFSLFWGTILSLAVACVWYLPMYQANGWKFVDEFFIQQHFQRYISNKYQHPQPFYFFFWVLPLMTLPWLPFFLASLWNMISRKIGKSSTEKFPTFNNRLLTFALAWLLVPLVFFSISGSKLPGYILPALPAALILTADFVWRFVQKGNKRRIVVQAAAFVTFAVVILILQFFINNFTQAESVKNLIAIADLQGYRTEKVINLNTISHNAEFYAAGRLVRTGDGKLRRFYQVEEIVKEMRDENADDVLVLVPLEYLSQLTESDLVKTAVLGDNTELAIVLVKL